MNTFRSTSRGRPSQAALDRRALFDAQYEHAQIVADIPHLWSVVANVAFLQLDAGLKAFATVYREIGFEIDHPASEERSPWDEHLQYGH